VKTALRDRLAAGLREPGTKSLADLANIEKELAQVQGDIEAWSRYCGSASITSAMVVPGESGHGKESRRVTPLQLCELLLNL
jgi:hypothetical protein